MSAFEPREIELTGRSDAPDPADALRDALAAVMRELAAAGGGPHHLLSMQWETPDPAAVHPSRRAIDLAYREACGGFRPRPVLARAAGDDLRVTARARVAPAPVTPVWRGYTAAELAREYSPRGQVPDMAAVFARWTKDGAAFRADQRGLDLAYGASPSETLDLYRPPGVCCPPLWVFIHGGYWQASTKEQHAQFAAGMLEAGFAVANIEYGLVPETSLDRIVAQIRASLSFLVREAEALGIDADRIHLFGHSAGAHLAAMAVIDPDGPAVRSALFASGLFDLEPLTHLPVERLLGLGGDAAVGRLSPLRRQPRPGVRIGVVVGGRESDAFKRESQELARLWNVGDVLVVEGANHFDLLDGLLGGDLLDFARRIAGDDGEDADPRRLEIDPER